MLKRIKKRKESVDIFNQTGKIFVEPKVDDETDDGTDDETDDEQPDTTDMPDLENEEHDEQKTKKGRLKILTPDQMLSRLPISLAQLKAGNNSEKLNNEIRQLFYSLYRSKKLTRTIYNGLINTI